MIQDQLRRRWRQRSHRDQVGGLEENPLAQAIVVTLSKAVTFDDKHYQDKVEQLLGAWSEEEAGRLVREVCNQLPPAENVYGMVRHGGKAGITRATAERPWFAKLLLKLLCDKAPDAEFASIYVSVDNEREMHIDRNNAMGTLNYLLPVVVPSVVAKFGRSCAMVM